MGFLLLLFSNLLAFRLFDLIFMINLVGLILALTLGGHPGFLLRLFKMVIEVNIFQRFFSIKAPLIKVNIPINVGLYLNPIGFTN